jgi:hypothetical protein
MNYDKKQEFGCVFLFILLLMPFILRGQVKKKGEDQTKSAPLERIVKVSPMAALDPFSSTLAAYFEHQLFSRKKWISLEHEVGYTFNVSGLTTEALGYRVRSSYRRYFTKKWKERGNNYMSLSLMHRQFFDKGSDFLWRDERHYQQNLDYKLRISQQSLTFNIGTTRYFGNKDRFNLDASIGLGLRRSRVLFMNLPTDALTPSIPDIFEKNFKEYLGETTAKDRTHSFFNSVMAVKVGYVLVKNSMATKKSKFER